MTENTARVFQIRLEMRISRDQERLCCSYTFSFLKYTVWFLCLSVLPSFLQLPCSVAYIPSWEGDLVLEFAWHSVACSSMPLCPKCELPGGRTQTKFRIRSNPVIMRKSVLKASFGSRTEFVKYKVCELRNILNGKWLFWISLIYMIITLTHERANPF